MSLATASPAFDQKSFNTRVKYLGKEALKIINARYLSSNRTRDILGRLHSQEENCSAPP